MENSNEHKQPKVQVEDLVMIFGKSPRGEALSMLQSGESKDEILKKTGHVVGVSGVDFTVQQGEIFVVMGLSGSGKSTLIRCINRLIEPTSGKVLIDGDDILQASESELREIRRTKMAMVFQHFALLPHKTVLENAAYGLKVRGVDQEERHTAALEALDMVGLKQWAEKRPDNLSGGMKQRVGLARALATNPDILLMDEAFSALDPLIRRQMQNELMNLQQELKKTVLFITHDLNEALRVGNHVMIMRDGAVVQIGSPVDIITRPSDDYVAAFMQDVDHARVLTAEVVMKPAETLLMGHDAVTSALERARKMDDDAFYVVDRDQRVKGFVDIEGLTKAQKAGTKQVSKEFSPYMSADFPRTSRSASLTELYALLADGVPIAVVEADGRLVGAVHPLDVLSSLAQVEEVAEAANVSSVTGMGSDSDGEKSATERFGGEQTTGSSTTKGAPTDEDVETTVTQ